MPSIEKIKQKSLPICGISELIKGDFLLLDLLISSHAFLHRLDAEAIEITFDESFAWQELFCMCTLLVSAFVLFSQQKRYCTGEPTANNHKLYNPVY